MKSRFANISDKIFLTAAVWLLTTFLLGYFIPNIALKLIVSTSITLFILLLIKKRKVKPDFSPLKEFMYMSKDKRDEYLSAVIGKRYPAQLCDGLILSNGTAVAQLLDYEKTQLSAVVELIENAIRHGASKLLIFAPGGYTVGAEEGVLRAKISVKFFDEKETYLFFKAFDALPAKPQTHKKSKLSVFLESALSRDRVKSYSLTACLMLFMAYFSRYSIYYIVIAALCVTLSIISGTELIKRIKAKKHIN